MKQIIWVPVFLAITIMSSPAFAQSNESSPEELAVEGISKLMNALGVFIKSIPQYEAPEMNENGDIIIRRKQPKIDKKEPGPKLEETST
ncbi:hypothetical protein [Sneathiella sp.]|uniref:hypothetical protein n=1 Tax=Sneathiella sp. TaxID=1964365 RepID=UPI00356A8944